MEQKTSLVHRLMIVALIRPLFDLDLDHPNILSRQREAIDDR